MIARESYFQWALSLTTFIVLFFCASGTHTQSSALTGLPNTGILTYPNATEQNVVVGQEQVLLDAPAACDHYGAYLYRDSDDVWCLRIRNREGRKVRALINAEGRIRVPEAESITPIMASTSASGSGQQLFLDTNTPVMSVLIPIETASLHLEFESILLDDQTDCPVYIGSNLISPRSMPFRIEVKEFPTAEAGGTKDAECNYEHCLENIADFTFRLVYITPVHKFFPKVFVNVSGSGNSPAFDRRSICLTLNPSDASIFLGKLNDTNLFLPLVSEESFCVFIQCGGNRCVTYVDSDTAIGIIHAIAELTVDRTAAQRLSDLVNRLELNEAVAGDK